MFGLYDSWNEKWKFDLSTLNICFYLFKWTESFNIVAEHLIMHQNLEYGNITA